MYQFKGFMEFDSQLGGTSGTVRPIGDMSTHAATFATNVPSYSNPAFATFTLHSFKSATEIANTDIPVALSSQIFRIVDWLYTKQKSTQASVSTSSIIASLQQQFGSEAQNFGCGNLINDDGFVFPGHISWVNPTITSNSPTIGGQVKIWFSDPAFINEYDEYEIKIVPPLVNIDTFFSGFNSVTTALNSYSRSAQTNAITEAAGKSPYTKLKSFEYSYVDPLNSTQRVTTTWTALIYGASGDTLENTRLAIQQYIASKTQFTIGRWESIFPDIYTSIDFFLFPRWKNVAIPALSLQSGIYSSVSSPFKEVTYVKNIMPDFSAAHIEQYLRIFPTNYASIMVSVIGDKDNVASQRDILTLFPDLINLPTSDPQFNMMAAKTQNWVVFLQNLIFIAERATPSSSLPAGINRTTKNGIVFITQEFQGVNYMVASKASTPNYD